MLKNIEKLCQLRGISGNETIVREEIISQIKPFATTYSCDNIGNLIVFKKGKQTPVNKVLFSAHMDEVGYIVTGIEDNGLLTFSSVGGVQSGTTLGQRVLVGDNEIDGIIGAKAVHLLNEDEAKTVQKLDAMRIDIGADDKDEAEKMVRLGDEVTFDVPYTIMGEDKIIAKAIDDRAGCAFLIELIKQDLDYDCYFSFTVQEETGCTGAKTAAFAIKPDIAVAVESTTASDILDVSPAKTVCKQKKGAAVSFMDGGTIYDKSTYKKILAWAKEADIICQTKQGVFGGNESRSLQVCGGGAKVAAVSLPVRYIHSGSSVVDVEDIQNTIKLLTLLANKLPNC